MKTMVKSPGMRFDLLTQPLYALNMTRIDFFLFSESQSNGRFNGICYIEYVIKLNFAQKISFYFFKTMRTF